MKSSFFLFSVLWGLFLISPPQQALAKPFFASPNPFTGIGDNAADAFRGRNLLLHSCFGKKPQ